MMERTGKKESKLEVRSQSPPATDSVPAAVIDGADVGMCATDHSAAVSNKDPN